MSSGGYGADRDILSDFSKSLMKWNNETRFFKIYIKYSLLDNLQRRRLGRCFTHSYS